jgi:hypothetical protein
VGRHSPDQPGWPQLASPPAPAAAAPAAAPGPAGHLRRPPPPATSAHPAPTCTSCRSSSAELHCLRSGSGPRRAAASALPSVRPPATKQRSCGEYMAPTCGPAWGAAGRPVEQAGAGCCRHPRAHLARGSGTQRRAGARAGAGRLEQGRRGGARRTFCESLTRRQYMKSAMAGTSVVPCGASAEVRLTSRAWGVWRGQRQAGGVSARRGRGVVLGAQARSLAERG